MYLASLGLRAAVIGSPVSHSLSPFIYSFIGHHEKNVIDYTSIEVKADKKDEMLKRLIDESHFLGVNVTIPLKEVFLDRIHSLSPEVNAIGALNVLHVKDKKIKGYNTDIIGIQKTFEDKNFSLKNKTCLLLGAGGSAKAVTYVLGTGEALEVVIFNRSERNAELIGKFSSLFPNTKFVSVNDLSDPRLRDFSFDLVINATPLGMTGKESGATLFSELNRLTFNANSLAFDLIYTPEATEFLYVTSKLGLSSVGGLGMLIYQALASWKIWVGEIKNEKSLYDSLYNYLSGILWLRENSGPVYLAGFMGVGKSTIGELLATSLSRDFFDTDEIIQADSKLSIAEIFSKQGEARFREMESEAIEKTAASKNAIISLGGGALMNPENFKKLHESGLIIYLKASEKNLLKRINSEKGTRPLMANLSEKDQLKKISELLAIRKAVYEKAPIHIQTDNLSLEDCKFEILSAIGINRTKG